MNVVTKAQGKDLAAMGGEALPLAARQYWNLQSTLAAALTAAIITATAVLVKIDWIAFIALWVLLPLCVVSAILDITVVNRLQYRAYRYFCNPSLVEIRHGILMRAKTTISTVQILSVDIVQGPLLKSCGLVSVVFGTVGGTVKLGPVTPVSADTVRTQVMRALEIVP